jgi:hypothetical protein
VAGALLSLVLAGGIYLGLGAATPKEPVIMALIVRY